MAKTLFIDENETEQITIADGFWIKIPKEISYKLSSEIFQVGEGTKDVSAIGERVMLKLIKGWNIPESDKDGAPIAPITKEWIGRLPLKIITAISKVLEPKLATSKKKEPTSEG